MALRGEEGYTNLPHANRLPQKVRLSMVTGSREKPHHPNPPPPGTMPGKHTPCSPPGRFGGEGGIFITDLVSDVNVAGGSATDTTLSFNILDQSANPQRSPGHVTRTLQHLRRADARHL